MSMSTTIDVTTNILKGLSISEDARFIEPSLMVKVKDKSKTVIFDIDGTVADCNHRLHYIKNKPRDYKTFYSLCSFDTPIWDIIEMVKIMYNSGYSIVFCTGRSENCRVDTEEWLSNFFGGIQYVLYMRPLKNKLPDWMVKVNLAFDKGLTPDNVFAVFEDRKRVVEAWRDHGYRCYQVVQGDY